MNKGEDKDEIYRYLQRASAGHLLVLLLYLASSQILPHLLARLGFQSKSRPSLAFLEESFFQQLTKTIF